MYESVDDELLEIKYIGKYENEYIEPPTKRRDWVYTPSGRICTYIRSEHSNVNVIYKNEQHHNNVNEYTFTFVDLVNKVCYNMKLVFKKKDQELLPSLLRAHDNNLKVDSYYFTSENELVIIAAYDELVKQLVYKEDYSNQNLIHKETFVHTFSKRDEQSNTFRGRFFAFQSNKFVCYDGIDYILMVGDGEPIASPLPLNDTELAWVLVIYMVPKNPSGKDVPTKEYQIDYLSKNTTINERIKTIMGADGEMYGSFSFHTSGAYCRINGTELCFSLQTMGFIAGTGAWGDLGRLDYPGIIVGAYWTVDLKKLTDVKNRSPATQTELHQLMQEQADAYKVVLNDVLYIAQKIDFWHFDKDVGFISIFKKNQKYALSKSCAIIQKSCSDNAQSTSLDCKFSDASEEWYTLHPHGALLNFKFYYEKSIYFKVLKCLKPNLKSLSLNKALFHKNTPIKGHLAYRLCFNGKKSMEYPDVNEEKNTLKRKLPEETENIDL